MVAYDQLAGMIFNSAILIVGLIILIGIGIGIFILVRNQRRYNFICVILEKDGFGKPQCNFDKAGIFVDRVTKNKRFYMKKYAVGLNPDSVPYIKDDKNRKLVFLKRIGLKNFQYMKFDKLFDVPSEIEVGEEDVNWALDAYRRAKAVFGTTTLEKLMPYIGLAIMGVFILGMIYILINKFSVMAEVAQSLKDAADALRQASSGTTVIT